MTQKVAKKIAIKGFGSYTPSLSVTNDDLSKFLETDDDWILSRTGIKSRKISVSESNSDMCFEASKKIFKKTNFNPEDLDIIIVCTITSEYATPSDACILQKKLGAKNAFCFDLNAACTGFVYGLSVAEKMLRFGKYNSALVLGVDSLSKIVDWENRQTAVLFGDGCGGCLLTASENESFLAEDLHSDGDKYELLTGGHKPLDNVFVKEKTEPTPFFMDGRGIFDFVTKKAPESIYKLLQETNSNVEDYEYIVFHQANARIIEAISKKMKIDLDKFYINIGRYGNTSAGTLGIALDEMEDKGLIKIGSGKKIILTAFGGGVTWGSLFIQL